MLSILLRNGQVTNSQEIERNKTEDPPKIEICLPHAFFSSKTLTAKKFDKKLRLPKISAFFMGVNAISIFGGEPDLKSHLSPEPGIGLGVISRPDARWQVLNQIKHCPAFCA
jgi:hypothetical protein